tara:strand:+ start:91 stop:321 length:231 start_codon:yes stop_codon:yes gene_type:complete
MINSNDIQVILDDYSFQEAVKELIKLNTDIILNSDVDEKDVREICYLKIKVINEMMGHFESLASDSKIKHNNTRDK